MDAPRQGRPPLVEAMLDPAFYPAGPPRVELRETHISWVFLAGERVYKLKKPVVLPFLDYGSATRRREMCEAEVRLNRRLAPDVYLGVVAIVEEGGRFAFAPVDDDEAIDYVVEMRRIDEERSLAAIAARGELGSEHVDAVAARIASFHREADPAEPRWRDPGLLGKAVEDALSTLRQVGEPFLPADRIEAAVAFARSCLRRLEGELGERASRGCVRECHGDLRAEHVVLPPGEQLFVFDCVEFDPALREIDVAADLAFLVMDLARLAGEELSGRLVESYREAGGDPGSEPLVAFLASYRAWVRAMVACERLAEIADDHPARHQLQAEAGSLLDLGHRFAWRSRRPLLLILSGVSGSGKTTIATRLAALSGWPHLSSDLVRKRIAGISPTERAGPERYSAERSVETYAALGAAARREIADGGAAIVDATFDDHDKRAAFERGFGAEEVPRLWIECQAPTAVLEQRVRAREGDLERVSDAGLEVLRQQLQGREALTADARRLNTDAPLEEILAEIESSR